MAATRWLVSEPRQPRRRLLARPGGRLLLLGVIAFCAFLLDGAANYWSAAHLAEVIGLSAALGLLVAAAVLVVVLARRALDPRPAGRRQPSLR